MSRWLIRLNGEHFDLEELLKEFNSPEVKIIEEKGSFYLESSKFNEMNSANEILKIGKTLIRQINIVAKFNDDNFRDVIEDVVTQVENDGTKHNYIFLEGSVKIRTRCSAQLKIINSSESNNVNNQPSSSESLLELVKRNNIVADALSFFKENTWNSLYKSYEIITDDIGGKHQIIKNTWSTKSDLKRFTQTAQSRAAIGDSARHASNKYKPPAKPMTFPEARKFIKNILKKWLFRKN